MEIIMSEVEGLQEMTPGQRSALREFVGKFKWP